MLRSANIEKLSGGTFDVLIVGGGINGAVAAAALASRGASVALIDRGDFACFTSQESSNLVWGGFKYLQTYELSLVRHLCLSRNRLIRAYPANIREIRFLAALDDSAPYPPWFATVGALAYWGIGNFFTRVPRPLSRQAIQIEEPVINTKAVRGGMEYSDAWLVDNDSRFVFGFVRAALNVGAVCVNYMEHVGAERAGGVWRARLRDADGGTEYEATARVLVNATGPFVDELNVAHGIGTNHRIVLSKGIHLIVPRLARKERVLTFFDDTQRPFFVVPMGMRSMIGTTDTRVDSAEAVVTEEDRAFLLEQINARLALREPLTTADVIAERCGVRPLVVPADDNERTGEDWTALSRKHVVEVDDAHAYATIFGGKLTDCLNIGAEIGDAVERLGVPLERDRGDWYGEPPKATRREFFRQARLMKLEKLRRRTSFETLSTRLWRRYGLRSFAMLEAIRDDPTMADDVIEGTEYARVELYLAAQTEMVCRLEDFLRRRSKIALVMSHEDVAAAEGLQEACRILFGERAGERYDEYFRACAQTSA